MLTPNKLTPLFNRVLVEKVKLKQTESGILIPETNEDDNTIRARIVRLNQTAKQSGIYTEGQAILITKYAGVQLEKDGDYFMIAESDILATIAD